MDESVADFREKVQQRIACLMAGTLVLQLLTIMILIVFIDANSESKYYFYIFSICSMVTASIYFAWHSIIKENAFELLSFIICASLSNFHGAFITITDSPYLALTIISMFIICFTQIVYLCSYYTAYQRFSWRYMEQLETQEVEKIKVFKVYETMMSVLKLDFYLYSMCIATFIYYVLEHWNSLIVLGVICAAIAYFLMIVHSMIGLVSATQEKVNAMKWYVYLIPLVWMLKMANIVLVGVSPGSEIDGFILIQAIIIAVVDFLLLFLLGMLMIQRIKNNKTLIYSVIRRASDDAIRKPFFQFINRLYDIEVF